MEAPERPAAKSGGRWLRRIVLGVIVVAGIYVLRPLFHDLVMILWTHPALVQGVLVWAVLHYLVLHRSPSLTRVREGTVTDIQGKQVTRRSFQYRWLWALSGPLLFLIPLLFLPLGNWLSLVDLSQSLQFPATSSLPESTSQVRVLPQEVADRYARDSLQLSQYRLGRGAINLVNGRLQWTYPLVPDGPIIAFTRPAAGVITVDATTQEKRVRMIKGRLTLAEGILWWDNLWWQLYRHRYFVQGEPPLYATEGDQIWTLVPAIGYRFSLRWGIAHTVPYFAGVYRVSPTGQIDFLSPEQALTEASANTAAGRSLATSRLFPERLARLYATSYAYRRGLLNYLFVHTDQSEIQDVVDAGNQQPFLMPVKSDAGSSVGDPGGLVWFTSTKPFGHSGGIFKVFLVNARTGAQQAFTLPATESLTGPVGALDYVRRANPLVDWARFLLVEPLPFVRQGVLYWKTPIIPEDGAGVAFQAFVDSRTNQVTTLRTDDQIMAFVQGHPVTSAPLTPGPVLGEPSIPAPNTPASADQLLEQLRQELQRAQRTLEQLQTVRTPAARSGAVPTP